MQTLLNTIRDRAVRLDDAAFDYDPLLRLVGDRELVLLGECTHGTSEFYRMRGEICRRLIQEKGFDLIAVEGDFPDVARLNAWILGEIPGHAEEAFSEFERFPRWMWRNREMLDFVEWLREYNEGLPRKRRVRLYGLDLYSLYRSAETVIAYLEQNFPDQAEHARALWECLDSGGDSQRYGYEAAAGLRQACAGPVQRLLAEMLSADVPQDLPEANDELFHARHNLRVVQNAEAWYRALFQSRANTWNLRDRHMADTLEAVQAFHREQGGAGKAIVWAHNSHVGDARMTDMGSRGDLNLGQLARQKAGKDKVCLIGFTAYTGRVAAAHEWDGEVEHFTLRPARPDSFEHVFHRTELDRFFLPMGAGEGGALRESRLERAVGVIYRPSTERASHYFGASIAAQFDAVFHLDETSAVEPFDLPGHWHIHERLPETWPSGL